jgi:hypothetical protein
VARLALVREHVLDRRDEAPDLGLGPELFEELASDRFLSLLAELDCSAEEPEERLVLDLVSAPLDQDPVALADQSERQRADAA